MKRIEKKKYDVQNSAISTILGWIENDEIGLPELQRPFVWNTVKVRDLIDSLYHGYPIGYIITWDNPKVRLKDGSIGQGKKIIIDGQQRITALRAALMGDAVVTKKFEKKRIRIAFNPETGEFQTLTSPIEKDKRWISDISVLFGEVNFFEFVSQFAKDNDYDAMEISQPIQRLKDLANNDVGNIMLSSDLDISAVTEIFNRINSKGTELSSADFIMSKLAADTEHGGNDLRKTVEYFATLLEDPMILQNLMVNDTEFSSTDYYAKIKWAAKEQTNLYNPRFGDVFHVILGFEFGRSRHADLISLISGRDFNKKTYTEEAMQTAYARLSDGVLTVVNQSNFERYLMILKSLGMLTRDTLVLNGLGVLNFGYSLYLLLKRQDQSSMTNSQIEMIVKKWIIMSALTHRYGGSSESQSWQDITRFIKEDPLMVLKDVLRQNLSEDFWTVTLPQQLMTSSTQSNAWRVFEMTQVKDGDLAWLEKDHTVESVLNQQDNVHHIFPRAYLKREGLTQKQYNQVANYTQITQPRNLQISDQIPRDYLADPQITEFVTSDNFRENAIPEEVRQFDASNYDEFLRMRRQLMAQKIRHYFESL